MWNETRHGAPYAKHLSLSLKRGMLPMVPIGGMFFLKGSLTASALLLFVVCRLYGTTKFGLTGIGHKLCKLLNAITKPKEILDIPIYEGGTDFPKT